MNTINKKITLALIFIAGLALGAGGFYSFQAQDSLSPEKASEAAMGFINKSLEQDNVTASLVSVAEESGIYKLHLTIESNEYDSFMSKDGKYLFSTAFDLNAEKVKAAAVSLETLAKCLTENGAKFYGASWCSHCKNQKEMFGEAVQYLPYVECSAKDSKEQLSVCKDNNITSYPTWVFADGSRESGEVSFQKLSEKTGCLVK